MSNTPTGITGRKKENGQKRCEVATTDNKRSKQGRMECKIYTNAQGLLTHKKLIMMKMNPAIMTLTESRLTEEIDDSEVSMLGYSIVRCDSDSRFTGGVTIYIRNDIRYEIMLIRKIEPNCWSIAIEVKKK